MNLSIGLCLLISFSTREYSILLTAFFISFPNSPSSSKKEGPLFQSFFPPPPFPRPPPRPPTSPTIRYQCLAPPRTNPQTMPTGQAQPLTLHPTPVSTPFSIPVCFRSKTRPAYRLLSLLLLPPHPPLFILPLDPDSRSVLQMLPLSAAEAAPRAQRTRSPELPP